MCLLVDFGKVMCLSANELQQNSNASSREDYTPQILAVLFEILCIYIWPLWPFVFCLLLVNNSYNNVTTPSTNQRFWPDSGQILRHQYGVADVPPRETSPAAKSEEKRMFSQATQDYICHISENFNILSYLTWMGIFKSYIQSNPANNWYGHWKAHRKCLY